MFDFNLNHHLDSDEKMLLFFRPSRKAYIFQYILICLILALAIFFLFVQGNIRTPLFKAGVQILALIALVFAIIMELRLEYRIFSRRYGITNERVMYSSGIFSEKFKSARYNFITDLAITQTFWDKIINTGTLKIDTAGEDFHDIRYRKISNPVMVSRLINDQIPDRAPPLTPEQLAPRPELEQLDLKEDEIEKELKDIEEEEKKPMIQKKSSAKKKKK